MHKTIYLQTSYTVITDEFVMFGNDWKIKVDDIVAVFVTRQPTKRKYIIFPSIICLIIGFVEPFMLIIGGLMFSFAFIIRPRYVLRMRILGNLGEIRPICSYNRNELEDIKDSIFKAKSLSNNI